MTFNSRITQIKIQSFGDERGNHKMFCERVGVASNTGSNWMKEGYNIGREVIEKVLHAFPDIDANWLITGEGSMYKENITDKDAQEPLREYLPTTNFKLLPVMNLDIAGGSRNQEVDTSEYVRGYMPFVDAHDGDIACLVSGDSMSPAYPGGCFVQIRKIDRWREYLEFGRAYVIDLEDGRRLIKEMRRGETKDSFVLHSCNTEYEDSEVSKGMIYSVWLVVSKYHKSVM